MWDGFWFLANRRAWERLPADVRDIAAKHINAAAARRSATTSPSSTPACSRSSPPRAWSSTTPTPQPFRDKLRKAGFYAEWKGKFGDEAWAILEEYGRQAGMTRPWPRSRRDTRARTARAPRMARPSGQWAASIERDPRPPSSKSRSRSSSRPRSSFLFAGVVARFVLHTPARVVGRAGLHPVPLARHARRGRCVSAGRAHADDGDRGLGIAPDAGIARCRCDRGLRWPSSCSSRGRPSSMPQEETFITTPALGNHQCLARRGAAGRHWPDGGLRSCCGLPAWHRFGPRHWPCGTVRGDRRPVLACPARCSGSSAT